MSAAAAMRLADVGREPDRRPEFPLKGQGDSSSGTVVVSSSQR